MTEHFSDNELKCKCGCGKLPQKWAVDKLEELREGLRVYYADKGNPFKGLIINSAMRCEDQNKLIGGSLNSRHIKGIAFDIACNPQEAFDIARIAMELGFYGIETDSKKKFIHIDCRSIEERALYPFNRGV